MLIDNLPDCIYAKDIAGRKTMANPSDLKNLGCKTEAEAIGKSDFDFFPKDIAEKFWADDQKVIQGRPVIDREEYFVDEENRKRWLLTSKLPVRDREGKIVGLVGIGRDITDRKQAEEDLRRAKEELEKRVAERTAEISHERLLLRTLIDNLPDYVYAKDAEGRFTTANIAVARQMGFSSPNEIVGKSDFDLFPHELAVQYRAEEVKIMQSGQGLYNHEGPTVDKSKEGKNRWVSTTKVILRDAEGKVTGFIGLGRDITERKQTEEALARERLLLRTLIDNLPDCVYAKDTAGRKTLANPADLKNLRCKTETEATGKSDFDLFPKEIAEKFWADDLKVFAGQPVINREEYFFDEAGRKCWLLTSKLPLRDQNGAIVGLIGIGRDITDRKQAEEELRRKDERLLKVVTKTRCILNSGQVEGPAGWRERALNPESPFRWDLPVENEETAQEIVPLELAPGEKYQDAWVRTWNHDDFAQMNWNSGNALLNDLPYYRNEFRCTDKHGVEHWMQQYVTIRKLEENHWEVFCISTDISERKQVEEALARERLLLRTLIDTLPDYVYAKDAEGRFATANIAVARQMGFSSPNEIVGKSDFDLFPHELAAQYRADELKIIQSGQGLSNHEGPTVDKSKEKENRWVSTTKVILRDAEGKVTGFIGLGRDITVIKEAEAKLDQSRKELLEASRRAGMAEVATSVLHNVGNVLNSVNVASSCVADGLRKSKTANLSKIVALLREHEADLGHFITNDPKGRQLPGYLAQLAGHLAGEQADALEKLDRLQRNIEHIRGIVAMQQNYAKASGVLESLPIVDLVEDAVRMNVGSLERHNVKLLREYSETPPVLMDKHKVLQILVNVLRNAKQACDDSGKSDKQIILRVVNGNERIKISIIDNGVGIPAENMTRIFNHGFTTRKDGHGFGLHSGALAAKEIGGSLAAFSEGPGRGATFTLELPIQGQKANL